MALKIDYTLKLETLIYVFMLVIGLGITWGLTRGDVNMLRRDVDKQETVIEKISETERTIVTTEARLTAIVEDDHDTLKQRMSHRVEDK